MAKEIKFNTDAREALKRGVDQLANAVCQREICKLAQTNTKIIRSHVHRTPRTR